ncbi:MAG: hypothetical protein CSA58_02365 [Micrococcales bacterium]|nr:MAG: hypothetical protein CSB46_05585 [Micrococcales bacterium]PIE27823.1 MAG: hypothetical protein CSA58_02365 [Micrococcales bacterium]
MRNPAGLPCHYVERVPGPMRIRRIVLLTATAAVGLFSQTLAPVTAAEEGVAAEVHSVTVSLTERTSSDAAPDSGRQADGEQGRAHTHENDMGERPAGEQTAFLASEQIDTDQFAMVGAVLPGDNVKANSVQVRARALDGSWGKWQTLPADDQEGPDSDSAEYAGSEKRATAPVWVGDADAVQTRVVTDGSVSAAQVPADEQLELALVDPGRSAKDGTASGERMGAHGAARPAVIRRSDWGADERLTCSDRAAHPRAFAAVVHHTAGSNGYSSKAQAMRQIRGDYAYHTKTRGWCDIGYNFIVDKWGNVYEGRRGSITSARIGAHAAGFNKGTVGIAILGTYSRSTPPARTQAAVANVIAWRLSKYGAQPNSRVNYVPGAGSVKFPAGRQVNVPRVMGHRDVGLTSCPGTAAYRTLGGIRARAQSAVNAAAMTRAVYRDTLRREASDASVRYWQATAMTSRSRLITGISAHVDSRRRVVDTAYRLVLGRSASRSEQDHWGEQLRTGRVNDTTLVARLAGSAEFYRQAGSTRSGFVKLLFRRVLEREARAGDVKTWGAATARRGRTSVADMVYGSVEGAHRRIDRGYRAYLGRAPHPAARTSRAAAVRRYGDEALRRSLMSSSEYARRARQRY